MNAAEVGMTFEEWGEVLRVASTIWPQSRIFFDDPPRAQRTPTRTWWAALCRFQTDDVLAAIGRLGMSSPFWPSLADLVQTVREVAAERVAQVLKAERDGRDRLAAPSQETVAERLAVFDRTSAATRREQAIEVRRSIALVGRGESGACDPAEVGVWERRLRELVARGWPDREVNGSRPAPCGPRPPA